MHTGLQNTTIAELRDLWTRIEDHGFDWISIWDHFYSADFSGYECHEAVACHAALACHTSRVRVGSLVYCAGYRHPAVLANAIATIDHLSGGRADLGLGAGWAFNEYAAYGIPFPSAGERLDLLEESIQAIRGLLRQEVTDFDGRALPAHRGALRAQAGAGRAADLGGRRRREAHAAHRGASTPTAGTCRSSRPRTWPTSAGCSPTTAPPSAATRRDPHRGQRRAVPGRRRARAPSSAGWPRRVRPGVLIGSPDQLVQRIGEYVEAGADQINIAMRAPWDLTLLDLATEAIEQLRAA